MRIKPHSIEEMTELLELEISIRFYGNGTVNSKRKNAFLVIIDQLRLCNFPIALVRFTQMFDLNYCMIEL
ncbi:CLUMA_CG015681, isoform A [Clunio marinus]|uniref:CLUMA_CG015681, isoform A n=1 Tax=Clunio marinus TaxID=568069 RepID=A0A1J1IPT8_9DIPT|nr:CLUMA_CG015681, isoform A [Clunio marinus]